MRDEFQDQRWHQKLTSEYGEMMKDRKRYAETDRARLPAEALKKAETWDAKTGANLLLCGPTGAGKSRIAWEILRRWMVENWIRCKAVAETELAIEVGDRASKGELRAYLDPLCTIPILLLDDLGKAPPTERFIASLYHIADARYAAKLTSIVTTQFSHKELKARMASRTDTESNALAILRRLCEDAVIIEIPCNAGNRKDRRARGSY